MTQKERESLYSDIQRLLRWFEICPDEERDDVRTELMGKVALYMGNA